jgi:signal peptidase I
MDNETAELFDPQINKSNEFFSFLWELVKIVAVAIALVVVVKTFLVQPFCVKGQSMQETYNDEDYILIDKLSYRLHPPTRFDVIVFKYPYDTTEYYIKRIIGLPGETVEIRDSKVIIHNDAHPEGITLDEVSYLLPAQRTSGIEPKKLTSDQYFVLGDNRPQSSDSRFWGPLGKEFITGKVFARVLPQSRFCQLITSKVN